MKMKVRLVAGLLAVAAMAALFGIALAYLGVHLRKAIAFAGFGLC